MNLRDVIALSSGNLRRLKLRTFLTVAGVVIAIAAFVSMVSFGAGNQEYITNQYNHLGLLTTLQVYPHETKDEDDSVKVVPLDDSAVVAMTRLPGVRLAYPFEALSVTVAFADTQFTTEAQALPQAAVKTKLFDRLEAGTYFANDTVRQVVLAGHLLKEMKLEKQDSLIGTTIVLSYRVSSLDSALSHVIFDEERPLRRRLKEIRYDSLLSLDYVRRTVKKEASEAAGRLIDGFLNAPEIRSESLTVVGILKNEMEDRGRIKPILLPVGIARKLKTGGFSNDPTQLLQQITSGNFFEAIDGEINSETYPRITLDIDPSYSYEAVRDSVKTMGFETFSYVDELKRIREFFTYFNMLLGMVGLIALVTASLGIANTMVMSIMERTREIGVLRSLGADKKDIRLLFLVESAVIGVVGAAGGILVGWLITRAASQIAKIVMVKKGIEAIELFALPLWLIGIALMFGLIVSLAAGFFPANRAARIDPVEALRNE